jgi:effector-binding domain-containing protein
MPNGPNDDRTVKPGRGVSHRRCLRPDVMARTALEGIDRSRETDSLGVVRPVVERLECEGGPVMTYDITRREVGDQPVVSIRDRVAASDMPAFIGRAFGELYGRLQVLAVPPTGEPLVLYHEFGPDGIDAEVCVPYAGDITASGRIASRVLPAATVAETLHVGPYDELPAAYAALSGWIAEHGLESVGPVRERYLNAPGPGVSPADYRTVIQMPIVEAAVPAR